MDPANLRRAPGIAPRRHAFIPQRHPLGGVKNDESQAADNRTDIEHHRSAGRNTEAMLGIQHSHRQRRERDHGQEGEHDPRQRGGEFGFTGNLTEAGRDDSYQPR